MIAGLRRSRRPRHHSGPRLVWVTLEQSCLGIQRSFGLYLPQGYDEALAPLPALYLLRGHEREWAGRQDRREGLRGVLQRLVGAGQIAPLVVVLPGLMPPGWGLGAAVNWSADADFAGGGSGRFEDHFFEVKAHVETHFKVARARHQCALDGFSMGGYSAVTLALRHPHLFGSVGAYDGSFMWSGQVDPRPGLRGWDRLWFSRLCAPFFRCEHLWDLPRMEAHNALQLLQRAGPDRLAAMRRIRFHVRSVADEKLGNRDRARNLVAALRRSGIENSFQEQDLALDARARHTWKWADRHLATTLKLHDQVFRGS